MYVIINEIKVMCKNSIIVQKSKNNKNFLQI